VDTRLATTTDEERDRGGCEFTGDCSTFCALDVGLRDEALEIDRSGCEFTGEAIDDSTTTCFGFFEVLGPGFGDGLFSL
jgi:hypothetical protein